jgi:hypothetical protein
MGIAEEVNPLVARMNPVKEAMNEILKAAGAASDLTGSHFVMM